jgi:hypothetical protein
MDSDTRQSTLILPDGRSEVVLYDTMCQAIAAAHRVDEAKDIRDKAEALATYARQANNAEAERQLREIRVRAERRCGELLAEREMARGAPGPGRGKAGHSAGPAFSGAQTLAALCIKKNQSSYWQKLAKMPTEEFEAALANTSRLPTASGILGITKSTTAGKSDAARKVRDYVRPMVEQGEPLNVQNVVEATGHSRIVAEAAIAFERGRAEGLAEASERAPTEPEPLPKTAQEKLAVAEKRLRAQLEAEFEQRVRDELRRRLEARDEEDTLAIEQANALLAHSTGRLRPPFTAEQYHQLLWALHPDNRDPAKVTAAFILIRQKKAVLCDDGPIKRKSSFAPLPKTLDELKAMRQKRQA